MNKHQLPKGHISILSPAFKYVPAAATDIAKTFARMRGQHLQPQPRPFAVVERPGHRSESDIEVLEAAWFLRQLPCPQPR